MSGAVANVPDERAEAGAQVLEPDKLAWFFVVRVRIAEQIPRQTDVAARVSVRLAEFDDPYAFHLSFRGDDFRFTDRRGLRATESGDTVVAISHIPRNNQQRPRMYEVVFFTAVCFSMRITPSETSLRRLVPPYW